VLEDVNVLLRFNCPDSECDKAMNSWNQLINHVKEKHGKVLCRVCVLSKKVFAHEHLMYTRKQLDKHNKEGDGDPSFRGHPECKFCSEYFYSSDELFVHCREKHEECHLCRKNGQKDMYFKDYKELEGHFRKDHYLCEDSGCLEKTFVVFDTDIDFKAHMAKEHGNTMSKSQKKMVAKIDFDFAFSGQNNRPQQRAGPSAPEEQTSNNSRQRLNAPPGFGGKLSIEQLGGSGGPSTSSNQTYHNADEWEQPHPDANWPAMPSTVPNYPAIMVEEIFFRDLLERKIVMSVEHTQKKEQEVGRHIVEAIRNDQKKWKAIRSHCTNYLAGFTLPEKLTDQMETIMGIDSFSKVSSRFADIFPDSKVRFRYFKF
jgi:hypothetical protein